MNQPENRAESVASRLRKLSEAISGDSTSARADAVSALAKMGELWAERLATDWRPPAAASSYPWEMTRLSLQAVVPGLAAAGAWQSRAAGKTTKSQVVALILAGNTPLMSWSPLAACLLAGHSVFVKMSRDEMAWPVLFRDSIAEVAPDVARRIEIGVWPGEDPRTEELVLVADVTIAFGSDTTLQSLRKLVPAGKPLFGYGHSISVAVWSSTGGAGAAGGFDQWLAQLQAQGNGIARDTLMYGQAGCLSPQALFVDINDPNPHLLPLLKSIAVDAFPLMAEVLKVSPVSDPAVATAVRRARDLAEFGEADVYGSRDLAWTLLAQPGPIALTPAIGHGVLTLIPFRDWATLPELFGAYRGKISSIGVAGSLTPEQKALLEAEGVSRICTIGEMQAPPLDWPNGGFDLLAAL